MSETPPPAAATRHSWPNLHPLPAEHAVLVVERELSEQEHARVARGLIPVEMEDKWFIYLEEMTLFFHRSWTGYCIYQATLARQGSGYAIAQVLVNRDPSQYGATNDDYDRKLLLFLINGLLLGQRHPLPIPSGVPAGMAAELHHHHVAGAGHKQAPQPLELKDLWRWLWRWLWWLVRGR